MVIPRSRSSGALSIWSKATNCAHPLVASTLVIAAVRVVLPWSTWPIVPTLTCGLVRENFSLPMMPPCFSRFYPLGGRRLAGGLGHDLFAHVLRRLLVGGELHGVGGASLRQRAQIGGIAEHLGKRHLAADHLGVAARLHLLHPAAPGGDVADDVAHVLLGGHHFD